MAAPQSSPLPEAPTRGEAEGQFVPKANAFVGALEPFRQQLQAQADYIQGGVDLVEQSVNSAVQSATAIATNAASSASSASGAAQSARDDAQAAASSALDSRDTSAANANFAGNWSSLSGAYSVPTSVFHEGYFWALVQNVSSIGDHEPGESSAWVIIQRAFRELSVEPTLSSNFRTGEHKLYGVQDGYKSRDLADIWDVTRASGETVLTPAGRIATVDPDTLPLTYVPETGGLGAAIYGQIDYVLQYSQDFTTGGRPWTFIGSGGTETNTGDPAPLDTGATWWNIVAGSGEIDVRIEQAIADTGEGEWMMHAVVDRLGFDIVRLIAVHVGQNTGSNTSTARFNIASGEVVSFDGSISEARIKKLQQGYLISASFSTDSGATSIRQRLELFDSSSDEGDGESGVRVAAMWMTRGQFDAPYELTADSTVTKPATNVVRELGEEFNRGEFTLLVDITPLEVSSAFFGVADSFSDSVYVASNVISIRSGGNSVFNRTYSAEAGRRDRLAVRVKSGDHAIAINNSIQNSSATGVPESLVRMRVRGAPWIVSPAGDASLVAHHIECIPRALSDAELIEWTRG